MGKTRPAENLPHIESLVAVRADVLSDAEHALGNLFQRLYHVTRVAREGLGPYADRLSGTLHDLEQLLEVLFDYVSPVDLDLRPVKCTRVTESLAVHLHALASAEVRLETLPDVHVLADARVLGRSFQLMACALTKDLAAAQAVALSAGRHQGGGRVEITARVSGRLGGAEPAVAGLAWEVAARLIDLHGGDLVRTRSADGLRVAVILPVAEGTHGAD